jgi:probable F420-dependent oxidoreductase
VLLDRLGRVGIWTRQLDEQPGTAAEAAAMELESLGYRSIWIPEALHREVISHATALLASTSTITVATGIARVHARSPQSAALAQRFLTDRFAGRFVLGLGVSHPRIVERMLGQTFARPLGTMRDYLDAIDATPGGTPAAADGAPRVLAALGPKMLALAAKRSAGAHTYLAPVAHTEWAREVLGPEVVLAPAIKVVLARDHADPAAVARASLGPPLLQPAYAGNMVRFGFGDDELAEHLSDRVVAALTAIGDVDAVVDRVREHLDAGADHVCVEVLTGDDTTIPLDAWRRLAPALTELG